MTLRLAIVTVLLLFAAGCSESVAEGTIVSHRVTENEVASMGSDDSDVQVQPRSPVKVVGKFTNVEGDGEHEWGISVSLWKQDGNIYGLFSGGGLRLVGDPPTGILTDQAFDEETGKLSFATQTSEIGYYRFEGVLTKNKLVGKLTDSFHNGKAEKVTLKRDKEWSEELMDDYATYEEWMIYANRILKRLGPRR